MKEFAAHATTDDRPAHVVMLLIHVKNRYLDIQDRPLHIELDHMASSSSVHVELDAVHVLYVQHQLPALTYAGKTKRARMRRRSQLTH